MISDPGFYAVAIPAVVLLGLGKGGFAGLGALSLPLLALQISPLKGAAIMLPILIVQDVVTVSAYWRKWDWNNLRALYPGAFVGVFVAYLLATYISEAGFELALGSVSMVFGLRNLLDTRVMPPKPATTAGGLMWGVITGFTSMVANTGGPPFQIYVTPQRLPRDVYIGTGSIFFFVINWIKVPPFTALGLFTRETITTSLALFPLAIVATWCGVLLVRRVSPDDFYRIVYGLMALVGLKLVWDGVRGLGAF